MRREKSPVRKDWEKTVAEQGLTFHNKIMPGYSYWDESARYKFSLDQINVLEKAGNDINELCLAAGEAIIKHDWWDRLGLEPHQIELIKSSWHLWQQHLYGRFDFLYDGVNPPKMLEYNADTPTSLIESAVIQWYWLKDLGLPDQFNSLHEKMIERWKQLKIDYKSPVYFTCPRKFEEDYVTTQYLMETCRQAGLDVQFIDIFEVGWNETNKSFRDVKEQVIKNLFKLYPWEWLLADKFGTNIRHDRINIIEPAWKMMWSNKGILPILWEIAPNHPNLLPAFYTKKEIGDRPYVAKPLFSREGANIEINAGDIKVETDGEYGEEGYVYQEFFKVEFDGQKPVLGLWMIGDYCCGMGVRESDSWITNNFSRFVPHYFTE